MLNFLANRQRSAEWMDDPAIDPLTLRSSLQFLRRTNSILGYARRTLWHLKRFSRNWRPGQRIVIADVATGSADIPLAVIRWGRSAGFDVRVVAIDLHAATMDFARQWSDEPQHLQFVRGDARRLPLADGGVDYAMCSLFLHHLSDEDAIAAIAELNRVARRGIVLADLIRNRRMYFWIRLATLASTPIIRHDAVASIRQCFSPAEAQALARHAGVDYAHYHTHFGHRFVLAGEKPAPKPPTGR
jgi:ubiquinone/menaquinone biosynthesis C-methylase UbiE